MTEQTEIKTLNGGSIDYAHYIAKSRKLRSDDTYRNLALFSRLFGKTKLKTRSLVATLVEQAHLFWSDLTAGTFAKSG